MWRNAARSKKVVGPSARKKAIAYLKKKYKRGLEMCCQVVGISRSTFYYQQQLDDSEVITKLEELAEKLPGRGFEEYYNRIRREGHKWARSRVLRVYRALGMVKTSKKEKETPRAGQKATVPTSRVK